MKNQTLVFIFCFLSLNVFAQHNNGLVSYNMSKTYEGYTMIYPHNQPNVYLINNCGEIVHSWTDEANFRPANTAYLTDEGNLVKTKRGADISQDAIWAGGGGDMIEIRSWENDLLWEFSMNNDSMRLHHDIAPMDNGNILAIAWELKTNEEAIAAGRDEAKLNQINLWPECIIEIDPSTDEIVWEWHAWDHLIQDHDDTKDNFGVVANNPQLIDLNYDTQDGKADWLHFNAIDYNEELDQILLSVPYFDEIWVIDHSTNTEQAAGNFGGNSNHGGDLIYRVGNQRAYQKGDSTDQILFFQHDAHWIDDFIPGSHPKYGHMMLFNNRVGEDYSSVETFKTAWSMYVTDYPKFDGTWPPYELTNTITHPTPTEVYSTGLSSAQLLPNNNTLICSGRTGYIVELSSQNEIVWEYKTPLAQGRPVPRDTTLSTNDNLTFRAYKYPTDYIAFEDKDLESKGHIETNPDLEWCDRLVSVSTPLQTEAKIFPNPTNGMLHLSWNTGGLIQVDIYDLMGRHRLSDSANGGMKYLDISNLEGGFYFVHIDGQIAAKLVVSNQ